MLLLGCASPSLSQTKALAAHTLPHVSECGRCFRCHAESLHERAQPAGTEGAPRRTRGDESHAPGTARALGTHTTNPNCTGQRWTRSGTQLICFPRGTVKHQPNCTECTGCDTQLLHVAGIPTAVFGRDLPPDKHGSMSAHIYFAMYSGGKAVIKLEDGPETDSPKEAVPSTFRFLVGMDKLLSECGLLHMTPKTWLAPVNGVDPESGRLIWWDGLWMDFAVGVSLQQLEKEAADAHPRGVGLRELPS
ncbi:hypothetical protein FOA52_009785 [Chlamydomonas sp. UWO 241]|nr:hypothetical protein FOA52_009785 [Chlamydomonas sp. UWO 241]